VTKISTAILLAVLAWSQVGWAEHDAEDREIKSNPYADHIGDANKVAWTVSKGTETLTLDAFVKSGKFCEWRGHHEWTNNCTITTADFWKTWNSYGSDFCSICGRGRKKIKKTKTVEEWEP